MAEATTGGEGGPPPVACIIRACGLNDKHSNMLIHAFDVKDVMSMAYFVSEMLRCSPHVDNAKIGISLEYVELSPLQLKRLAAGFFLFLEYVAQQGEESFKYTEKSTGDFADRHGLNVLSPSSFEAKLDRKIKSITGVTTDGSERHDKKDRADCLEAVHGTCDLSKYIDVMETRFLAEHFQFSLVGFIQKHGIKVAGSRKKLYDSQSELKETIKYWLNAQNQRTKRHKKEV